MGPGGFVCSGHFSTVWQAIVTGEGHFVDHAPYFSLYWVYGVFEPKSTNLADMGSTGGTYVIYVDTMQQTEPFNYLDGETLKEFLPKFQSQLFTKATYIFRQGETSKGVLFIVVSGLAEIIITNEKDEDSVVGVRKPHEFLGETVLFFPDKSYPASAKAVEDTLCLMVPKAEFEALLQKNTAFSGYFTRLLADRMRSLYEEVVLEQSYLASGLESKPFRKRVVDIMSSPVITCSAGHKIHQVAQILTEHNISAVVVVNQQGQPVGIINHKDLVSKVLSVYPIDSELTADMIMNPNPVSLPPNAFYYQSLLAMVQNQCRHVLIMDGDNLIGIVSMHDIIKSRSSGALNTVDNIESRKTVQGLADSTSEVDKVLTAMVAENASAEEIFEVISEFYDRITRKIIQIAEAEMIAEGFGPPPVDYCWITMGSGGRKEQTLRTDQDNGIIYQDVPASQSEKVADYFSRLAGKVVEGLYQCGFAKCKGNVMATNPEWCRPLRQWYRVVSQWVSEPVPAMVRFLTIFLDFRPVYGQKQLAQDLRQFVLRRFQESPVMLHFLAKDDLEHKVPLGFFRQFITEKSGEHKDEIDLKRAVCVHVVDCVRIFAFKAGITETTTFGRLRALKASGTMAEEDVDFFFTTYETLMSIRLKVNLEKFAQGLPADNYINPHKLSKRETSILRHSFLAVSRLQNFTGATFRVEGY